MGGAGNLIREAIKIGSPELKKAAKEAAKHLKEIYKLTRPPLKKAPLPQGKKLPTKSIGHK